MSGRNKKILGTTIIIMAGILLLMKIEDIGGWKIVIVSMLYLLGFGIWLSGRNQK